MGAYFAYVRHPFPAAGAPRVAEALAATHGALCLPGTAFGPGQSGHLRLAFANTELSGIGAVAGRLSGMRHAA